LPEAERDTRRPRGFDLSLGGLLTTARGGNKPVGGSFAHFSGAVMAERVSCPPAPGPLEAYAARFDDLFSTLAKRRGFREYLAGLLLPRDRNKALTCLAGTEPVLGDQHRSVQRLQFFLSESAWDHERVNARRVELLLSDPATSRMRAGCWSSTIPGTAQTGERPRRWASNASAPSGRSPLASSQ
ncbi:hypothetical protein AB0902_36560, partial [Streptomyces syringium]